VGEAANYSGGSRQQQSRLGVLAGRELTTADTTKKSRQEVKAAEISSHHALMPPPRPRVGQVLLALF
jgi:hypothetical protein